VAELVPDAGFGVYGLPAPVTVTGIVARISPTCAVTLVSPGLFPVTTPLELTVATAGFPVLHTTPDRTALAALVPSDINPLRASCMVCPGAIWIAGGLTVND